MKNFLELLVVNIFVFLDVWEDWKKLKCYVYFVIENLKL